MGANQTGCFLASVLLYFHWSGLNSIRCIVKSQKGGAGDPPDLDPQDRAVWPVGQVHMLGLEQKPSPHELRQIAAKEKRAPSEAT